MVLHEMRLTEQNKIKFKRNLDGNIKNIFKFELIIKEKNETFFMLQVFSLLKS